jgi:hypothetical protein
VSLSRNGVASQVILSSSGQSLGTNAAATRQKMTAIPLDLEVPKVLTARYPELFGGGPGLIVSPNGAGGSSSSTTTFTVPSDPGVPRLPALSVGEFILFVDYDIPTSGLEANVLLLKHTTPPEPAPEFPAGLETSLFGKPQNPAAPGNEQSNAAQLRVYDTPKRLWRLGQVVNVVTPPPPLASALASPPFLSPTSLKTASTTASGGFAGPPPPTVEGFLNCDNASVQYEVVKYGLVSTAGSVVDALSLNPMQKKSLVCKQVPQNRLLDLHHRIPQPAGPPMAGSGAGNTGPGLPRPPGGLGTTFTSSLKGPTQSGLTLDIDQLLGAGTAESASKSASPRQRSRSPGTNGINGSGVGTPIDTALDSTINTASALRSHASGKLESKSSRARLPRSKAGGLLSLGAGDDGGDDRSSLKRQASSVGDGAGNRFHPADFPKLDQSNLVFVPLYTYPSSSSNETVATHQSSSRLHDYPSALDMLEAGGGGGVAGGTDGLTVRSFLNPHSPLSRPSLVGAYQSQWNQDHRSSVFASKSLESVTMGKSHGGFSGSQSTEKILIGSQGTPTMPMASSQQLLGSFVPGSPLTGFGASFGAPGGSSTKTSSVGIHSSSSQSQSQGSTSGEVKDSSSALDVPTILPKGPSPLLQPPVLAKRSISPGLSRSFNALSMSFGTKLALQNAIGPNSRLDGDNGAPKPDPIPVTVKISHRQVLLRNVNPLLIDFLVAPSEKKPTSTEGDILPVAGNGGGVGASRSPADPSLATVNDPMKLLTAPKKPSKDRRNSSINRTGRYNDLSNTMKSRMGTPQEGMGSPTSLLNTTAASQRELKKKSSTMDLNGGGTLTKVKLAKAQTAAFVPRQVVKLLAALVHAVDQVSLIQQRMSSGLVAPAAGSGGFSGLGSVAQIGAHSAQQNDASQSARLGSRRTLPPSLNNVLFGSGGSEDKEQPFPNGDRRRSSDMIMMIPAILTGSLGAANIGGDGEKGANNSSTTGGFLPAPTPMPQFVPPSVIPPDEPGEETHRLSFLGGPPRGLGSTLKPSLFPSGMASASSHTNSSTSSASSAPPVDSSNVFLRKLVEKQIGSDAGLDALALKKSAREMKEGATDGAALRSGPGLGRGDGRGNRFLQISGINIREVEERQSIFSFGADAASVLAIALSHVAPPPSLALRDIARHSFDGELKVSPGTGNSGPSPFRFGALHTQHQALDFGNTLHVARFGAVKLNHCLEALNAVASPTTRRNTLNIGVGVSLAGSTDGHRRSTIGLSSCTSPISPPSVFPPPRPTGIPAGPSASQRKLSRLVVTFVAHETDESDWLELSRCLTSVPLLSELQSFHVADISTLQNLLPDLAFSVDGHDTISPTTIYPTARRNTLSAKAKNATFATLVQGWLSPSQREKALQEPDFALAKATLIETIFSRVAAHISHVTQERSSSRQGQPQDRLGDGQGLIAGVRTTLWQKINVSHLTSLTLSGLGLEYQDLKPFMTHLPVTPSGNNSGEEPVIGSCSMALPCLLQHLDVSDNNLGDDFAINFAAWLKFSAPDSPTKPTRRLSSNPGQSVEGGKDDTAQKGQVVGRAAAWSLQTVKLSKNPISEDGIFALSQAILNAPVSSPLHFMELACVRCPPQVVGNLLEPCRVPENPAGWTLRHHPRTEKRQRQRLRLIAFAVTRGTKSASKKGSIPASQAQSQGQSRATPDTSRETGTALQHLFSFFSVFARPNPMNVVY